MPKLDCAPVRGSYASTHTLKDPKLVGEVNEAKITINNIGTVALLDTGSCVNSVLETFYKDNLFDTEIESLKEVLNIECADGQQLPYLGCIEAEITMIKD